MRESSEAWESHKGSLAGSHLDTQYRGKLMRKPEGQWAIISCCRRSVNLIRVTYHPSQKFKFSKTLAGTKAAGFQTIHMQISGDWGQS